MKRLLFLCLIATNLTAQCDVNRTARSYMAIPSFFGLYLNGQCIEGIIRDTVICVKFPPSNIGTIAAFSYSSPTGQPAYVTGFVQYDEACTSIDYTPNILPNTDSVTVCYTIQANYIDNFCPYGIQANGLAVEFCGVWAEFQQNIATIRFQTCSNIGTHYFEILDSQDAIHYEPIARVEPIQPTWAESSYYSKQVQLNRGGIHYLCIREVDYNGNYTQSDTVVLDVPLVINPQMQQFDMVGRKVQTGYKWAIK